ncbi:ChaN family lipoprotein [Thalassococcus sp. CAU 1522]|uniref:ChaN family lipoprotein n=1 Tax=Thalassococcus arenae TaxID=2851652 RepID=A0ABS6N832_9RHOB|nr:ChaN family lipoprotein [Thalassococcus arenae]MBV2359968.1 ChaN family lipoprotein [Thalassococcus arenae]
MRHFIFAIAISAPAASVAGGVFDGAEVVFLGEQHDNATHHQVQAEIVAELNPPALVFEMLTPEQAARVTPALISDEAALEAALGWNASGWPDFAMYYPIFAAAPEARVFGAAVPRDAAGRVRDEGIVAVFGPGARDYGLTDALEPGQQAAQEQLQFEAHCNAMPEEMLPMMVDIQRLRDARLAQEAARAFADEGGPVVVITGNGHARKDWGAPVYLDRVLPGLRIVSLGQGEEAYGDPAGEFDLVKVGPDTDRGDPCEAFR